MTLKEGGQNMALTDGSLNPGFQEEDGGGGGGGVAEQPEPEPAEQRPSTAVKLDSDYRQLEPFAGMSKEVVLLHSSRARYRVPREVLFWLTVSVVLALLAVTVTVISMSPRCLLWWQRSPVYQVYPRSFKDSDGDGVGDLRGIKEQLHHFHFLNVQSVWVAPFYRSPMKDFGYDVEDFLDVDPLFGTMQDFEDLLAEMHNQGLKLIMDFIPNHTSDRHRWFNLSRTRDPHYEDYYVWSDCNASSPRPNNWVSVFGNSSWTFDDVREQCYLHQFLREQPDLNLRNPRVRQEMIDILDFWLKKGVDGFRMDAVKHILEAEHLRDEPQVDPNRAPESITSHWDLHHDYTTTQLGLHDLLREWRAHMDVHSREPGRYRLMVTESYDYDEVEKTMMYYGTPLVKESDFPFNFYLLDLPRNSSGSWVQHLVHLWMNNMPPGHWANWVVGNHDQPRVATLVGHNKARVVNMLMLTLPGTPITYYGEEIGMENINITHGQIQDPAGKHNASASRDPQRSPMQWSGDANAGFNNRTNVTWLPVHPEYGRVNVEVQKNDSGSTLAQYRFLSVLRQAELALTRGWFCFVYADRHVFSFLREQDGLRRSFLMLLNFGGGAAVTDLSSVAELPEQLTVLMSTEPDRDGALHPKSAIVTQGGEGLIFQLSSHTPFNPRHPGECFISEKACYLQALDLLYKC